MFNKCFLLLIKKCNFTMFDSCNCLVNLEMFNDVSIGPSFVKLTRVLTEIWSYRHDRSINVEIILWRRFKYFCKNFNCSAKCVFYNEMFETYIDFSRNIWKIK